MTKRPNYTYFNAIAEFGKPSFELIVGNILVPSEYLEKLLLSGTLDRVWVQLHKVLKWKEYS